MISYCYSDVFTGVAESILAHSAAVPAAAGTSGLTGPVAAASVRRIRLRQLSVSGTAISVINTNNTVLTKISGGTAATPKTYEQLKNLKS